MSVVELGVDICPVAELVTVSVKCHHVGDL